MEKEYYTLTELTERWDFCLHDALYLAENNICRFWINLPESDAIRFRKESNNGLTYDLPLENCQAKGLLLLTTEDVRRIIIYKTANVIQLPCQDDMTVFVRLKTVRELTIDDVLILCKDKLRLEKELGFFDKKAKVKSADICHNIDDFFIEELPNGYTKFSYHGKSYVYGFVQSKIIKQLYDAAKDGRIWIYDKTLLKNAGSTSYRLGDVFRPHKEWMELIKSNKQGLYRLYLE